MDDSTKVGSRDPDVPGTVTDPLSSISPDPSTPSAVASPLSSLVIIENTSADHSASETSNASRNSCSTMTENILSDKVSGINTMPEYPSAMTEIVSANRARPDVQDVICGSPVHKRPRLDPTDTSVHTERVIDGLVHKQAGSTTMDNHNCDSEEVTAEDSESADIQTKTTIKRASPVSESEEPRKSSTDNTRGLPKRRLNHSTESILDICDAERKLNRSVHSILGQADEQIVNQASQEFWLESIDYSRDTSISKECIGSSEKTEIAMKRLLMTASGHLPPCNPSALQGDCGVRSNSNSGAPYNPSETYSISLSNADTCASPFTLTNHQRNLSLMAITSQAFAVAVSPSAEPQFLPHVKLGSAPFSNPSFYSGRHPSHIVHPVSQNAGEVCVVDYAPSANFSGTQTTSEVDENDTPSTSFSDTQTSGAFCEAEVPRTSLSGTQTSSEGCDVDVPRTSFSGMEISECSDVGSTSSSIHDSDRCLCQASSVSGVTTARCRSFCQKCEAKRLQETTSCDMDSVDGENDNVSSVASGQHHPENQWSLASAEPELKPILDQVPNEVLVHIFSFLPIATLLSSMIRVCRKWRSAVLNPSLWHNLDVRNLPRLEDQTLLQLAQRSNRVRSLNLSCCQTVLLTDKGVSHVLDSCAGCLEYLNLYGCTFLRKRTFSSIGENCHNLTFLNLSGCFSLTDSAVESISKGCPRLETVFMSQCLMVTDVGVSAVAKSCHLRALRLCRLPQVTDKGLMVICDTCPDLQSLYLMGCSLTDKVLVHLAKLRNVEDLDISHLHSVSPDVLKHISSSCTKLHTLGMSLNFITDEAVSPVVQNCRNLRNLILVSSCLTDEGMWSIAAHAKNLERLDLAWSRRITDAGVAHVSERCPRLSYFNLLKCAQVTEGTVEVLKARYPRIYFSTFRQESLRILHSFDRLRNEDASR